MLIREMSDLHLEICPYFVPPMVKDEETILILAGDICPASYLSNDMAYHFFDSVKRFRAVIWVPGNHEYYSHHIDKADSKIKEWLNINNFNNVHFLNMESMIIDDIAFIGATLWTDIDKSNPIAKLKVENALNDYHLIYSTEFNTRLKVNETIIKHETHKKFIFDEIDKLTNQSREVIVISHHAPSKLSMHPKYAGNNLNPAFYSDLNDEISNQNSSIWIHGHTHTGFDYNLFNTRIICNPRGYSKIINLQKYMDMTEMKPINLDDLNDGNLMANFQSIFRQENYDFDPFLTFTI